MADAVVHLSSLAGSPLLDSAGERLGRIEDVVVRLDQGDALPPVIGLKARIGGRELFVPIDRVERLEPAAARTSTTKLNLAQFERRPGEVLLRADVLDHSLINVEHRPACDRARGRARVRSGQVAGCRDRPESRGRGCGGSCRDGFAGMTASTGSSSHGIEMEPFVGHVPTSRSEARHPPAAATASGADR